MKRAIVIGASSGMGLRFATSLLENNIKVYLIARREDRLFELSKKYKNAIPVPMDVTSKESVKDFLSNLSKDNIFIDTFVFCAGKGKIGISNNLPIEEQIEMIDLNFKALVFFTLKIIPFMKKGGRIILLNSAAAFSPQPGFNIYAASKAGSNYFAMALRQEIRPLMISVTSVCPGPVNTEFFSVAGKKPNGLKRLFMADPDKVVKKALKDAKNKRAYSVYSISTKIALLFSKLIPFTVIIKLFDLLQNNPRRKNERRNN